MTQVEQGGPITKESIRELKPVISLRPFADKPVGKLISVKIDSPMTEPDTDSTTTTTTTS